jgi:hypothetical protein
VSNTAIWDKLSRPDPKALKAFQRSGGFRGTAINPMHTLHTVTEVFGPCGTGWNMTKPEFQIVGSNVYCTVGVAYSGSDKPVWGVGGEALTGRGDDEAFKKAYTDALGNALKHLGANADIYFNLWDGNKYVDETPEPAPEPKKAYERNGIVKSEFDRLTKGIRQIENTGNLEDLALFWKNNSETIKNLPADWRKMLEESKDEAKDVLSAKVAA